MKINATTNSDNIAIFTESSTYAAAIDDIVGKFFKNGFSEYVPHCAPSASRQNLYLELLVSTA